jgi:hypothetical protein
LQNEEQEKEFIQRILKALPLRLPQKDPHLSELLEWKIQLYQPKPPKRTQRKRGYDDKGHLPDETKPRVTYDSTEPFEEEQDVFDLLLRQTDGLFRKFFPG